jgi:hypothetical protein
MKTYQAGALGRRPLCAVKGDAFGVVEGLGPALVCAYNSGIAYYGLRSNALFARTKHVQESGH